MDNLKKIATSPTLAINQLALKAAEGGKVVYKFGFGQSPFSPPESIFEALRNNVHKTSYTNIQGLLELRKKICDFYGDVYEINYIPEDILIAPGSKVLLFCLLSCFKNADVFIPQPSWVSYGPQVEIAGLNSIRIKSSFDEKWRVTPGNLNEALKEGKHQQRILIMNYPGNPDGLSYTKQELEELIAIFKKHNMLVISDEIYSLLSFGVEHIPMATLYPENTITTTGLSKWCSVGGWRLGVALLPASLDASIKKTLVGIASEVYSSASAPIQEAAIEAYRNFDGIRPFLDNQNAILASIANEVYERLTRANVKLHKPEGAFYVFPDFSNFTDQLKNNGISDGETLCKRLAEDMGVMMLPGGAFGLPNQRLLARLAFVDFNYNGQSKNFNVHRDCKHLLEGIDKLCNWLKNL
ncbi:MAG: aspartate aminotransferase [Patiriisocius sp.]|jgi:aspartate aminotransferase